MLSLLLRKKGQKQQLSKLALAMCGFGTANKLSGEGKKRNWKLHQL